MHRPTDSNRHAFNVVRSKETRTRGISRSTIRVSSDGAASSGDFDQRVDLELQVDDLVTSIANGIRRVLPRRAG